MASKPCLVPVFAAMCTCGGWVGVAVDEAQYAKENAKAVAKWMRDGYRIDKITVNDVRTGKVQMCECERRSNKRSITLFGE